MGEVISFRVARLEQHIRALKIAAGRASTQEQLVKLWREIGQAQDELEALRGLDTDSPPQVSGG